MENFTQKFKNENKGITLIALVITIIVLLILAGVSILTLTGQNGLLSKGNTAVTETSHSQVREGVILKNTENITVNKTEGKSTTIVQFLQTSEVIGQTPEEEGKYIINTEKLLGNKMSLGNGSYEDGQFKDVYVFEEYTGEVESGNKEGTKLATTGITKIAESEATETKYKVMYYDKSSIGTEILDLGNAKKVITNLEGEKITVKSINDSGETIGGVKFSVYTDRQCTTLCNNQQNIQTGTNGLCEIVVPSVGTYYVKIDEAPDGYFRSDLLKFEIKEDDDEPVWEITLSAQIQNGLFSGYMRSLEDTQETEFSVNKTCNLTLDLSDLFGADGKSAKLKLYKFASIDQSKKITYHAQIDEYNDIICDDDIIVKEQDIVISDTPIQFENLQVGIYYILVEIENYDYYTFVSLPTFFTEGYISYNVINSYDQDVGGGTNGFAGRIAFSNLIISSTISEENFHENENAVIVYQIEGTIDGDSKYSDVVTVTHTTAGTKKVTIEGIPVGSEVTVIPVYGGGNYGLLEGDEEPYLSERENKEISFSFQHLQSSISERVTIYHIKCKDGESSFTREIFSGNSNGIEMNTEIDGNGIHVIINNAEEGEEKWIRIKTLCGSKVIVATNGEGWNPGGEENYLPYENILNPGGVTNEVTVEHSLYDIENYDINNYEYTIVVIEEDIEVLYDEQGIPYADWTMSEEGGSEEGGGE